MLLCGRRRLLLLHCKGFMKGWTRGMLHDNTGKLSKQDQTKSVVFHFIGLRHKFTPRFGVFHTSFRSKIFGNTIAQTLTSCKLRNSRRLVNIKRRFDYVFLSLVVEKHASLILISMSCI